MEARCEESVSNGARASPPYKARAAQLPHLKLDRELVSHNVMVSDLEKKVHEVFLKSRDMLEVIEGLR